MRSTGLPLIRWFCVFAAVLSTGVAGFTLPALGSRLPLSFLPSGFAVAATCRWGRRMWPAVFFGAMAIDLLEEEPLAASIGVGAGLAAGAVLTCWILDLSGFDRMFARGRDVPLFILAAALGMVLAPTLALLGYNLSRPRLTFDALHWLRWWGNTTAGVLLVAPALIALSRESLQPLTGRRGELALWMVGVAACCALVLMGPGDLTRPVIALFALILMVVGTMRFGLVLSAAGAFVISLLTALSFAFRIGAFGELYELQGLVITWTFIAALNFVCLSITALLTQRDGAARAQLQAEHRYAEIFEGSPQPIWVHDRGTLRFLMVNEAALRQYGWSREEMLSLSVAALLAEDGAPAGNPSEPIETLHLTRSGRIIEVEVWSRPIDFAGQAAELVFAVDVTARRAFGRALLDAIATEQRRIGQEMHDGLGQELTGLALTARALANRAARERDSIAEDLDQLASLATSCIQDARLIVRGLSPLTDADGNLDMALEGLAQRSSLSGIAVRFRSHLDAPVSIELKSRNHLYRIAQEAVQNSLKHAGASAIDIELSASDGSVRLAILDDGRGLPADYPNGAGLGMRSMRFRSSAIGARLHIGRRADGSGNAVICEVPQKRGWGPGGLSAAGTGAV